MEERKRMKLCPYCDGRIEIDAVSCAFCGRNITHYTPIEETDERIEESGLTHEQTLSSLYPPPYHPKVNEDDFDEQTDEESDAKQQVDEEELSNTAGFFPTILTLSLGVQLFLFGLLLLFFSTDGRVILAWNAKWWFLYMLFSMPMLYFGYKKISRMSK